MEANATTYAPPHPLAAVHVSRAFEAPRDEVFRAWTDPEAIVRWFGLSKAFTRSAEADVRVGGGYSITLRMPPTMRTIRVVGTFLEVDPPQRLVYTFSWKPTPVFIAGMKDSKVTVEFLEHNSGTEVRLTHELLDKARVNAWHTWGWKSSLRRLARLL